MRGLAPPARARGAAFQLRPPTAGQRRVPRAAHTPALAISWEEVHHSSLLRARAVPRWSRPICANQKDIAPATGLSPTERARGATCHLRPPLCAAGFRVARASAPRRWLSLGRRRSTKASSVRTRRRTDFDAPILQNKLLRLQEASLLRRAHVVRRSSCGLQRQASAACHAQRARLRSLSLGSRHSTRACCLRTPCRADHGRPLPIERTLRRREASLLRRVPVVRRASCDLHRQTSAVCHARRARLRSLSLGRRCITRACCARVPCRAGRGQSYP